MDALSLKKLVAKAALEYVVPGTVLGVGTGSTVDCFIDALAESGIALKDAVSSSVRSTEKLRAIGINVIDLNEAGRLSVYIDGADEIDPSFNLIKGGGGALTREKIVADASDQFVCIADQSKLVDVLGEFPLPVEVLPMAEALVTEQLTQLGGLVKRREGFVTDNQCIILDVSGLKIKNPLALEQQINQWPGVITNGIFALHAADVCLIGGESGVQILSKK